MADLTNELLGSAIVRKRGDTAPDRFTILDENGDARDVTSFAFVFTINTHKDPDPDLSIGTELVQIAGVITDAAAGEIEVRWNAGSEADQAVGQYWYDIEQTDAGGLKKTIAKNKYTFQQDITK